MHYLKNYTEMKVSEQEREILHKILDWMCDEEKDYGTYEYTFPGDVPFSFIRKRIYLSAKTQEEMIWG